MQHVSEYQVFKDMKHDMAYILIIVSSLVNAGNIVAQSNSRNPSGDTIDHSLLYANSSPRIQPVSENGKPVYLNDISTKAVADLREKFRDVENERWRKLSHGGYVAAFNKGDISYMVWYTAKGKWQSMVKKYKEELMPFEVRDLVKRTYYDYSILRIDEITIFQGGNKPTYLVHIQFKNNIKIVRVRSGEMDVYQALKNQ